MNPSKNVIHFGPPMSTTARESSVPAVLNRIEGGLNELELAFKLHAERIACVVGSGPISSEPGEKEPTSSVELSERIRLSAVRVDQITAALQQLTQRVEL